ncbi:MAG: hypothetical protein GF313_12485 [Caldithrix sp.]|nr:hypothetical protein [Caldithrix sp.]
MNPFLTGKTSKSRLPVKRFGYLLGAFFLILANIALYFDSGWAPILLLITMYFLTGGLWIPALINPFYKLFGKYIIPPVKDENGPETSDDTADKFNEN